MRAKVCYTLSPKLYHKCKPIATTRSAVPRRPRAASPYRRCTKSDRSHDSSRVQGELRSALRHTLDPAAPTTCDRDSVHRLPTLAEAHSVRDDEDSAPPSPPTSNSTRNVTSAPRKHEALSGGSLPFEAVIARNTILASRLVCGRPFFKTQAGGCAYKRTTRERGRVACGHAQPANVAFAAVGVAGPTARSARLSEGREIRVETSLDNRSVVRVVMHVASKLG